MFTEKRFERMTTYYTPPRYLTPVKPPALVIKAPREVNPLLALVANLQLAGKANASIGTASGTTANYQVAVMPDYSFVEQVESLKEVLILPPNRTLVNRG
jgi:hypothetical protein